MPIPKPEATETQNDYVGRCMHEIASEYDTNEQAVAICISTYKKESMSKIKDTNAKVMAKVAYDTNFKGINLFADGMDNPCWDGYEMIGTKELDGKEVPNCVPISESK